MSPRSHVSDRIVNSPIPGGVWRILPCVDLVLHFTFLLVYQVLWLKRFGFCSLVIFHAQNFVEPSYGLRS